MCGIAGITIPAGRELEVGRLRAASDLLEHRGPDDRGFLGWNRRDAVTTGRDAQVCERSEVAFVHRRLSILDLSDAGRQPMSSRDGRHHIVFNGEIYNFKELRKELEETGHTFTSTGDTEVLLVAYRTWGAAVLTRLVGMFAFAVLDTLEGTIFLARDFFGIKPLFYTFWNGTFAFASEIKPLLVLTGRPAIANSRRLFHYLRFGLTDHGGETLFKGVHQLPAAHHLLVDVHRTEESQPRRYWDLPMEKRCDLSFDEAAEKLRELFLESVRLHLRSDVPVGGALSGGIDSSAIVMGMRHLRGEELDLHAVSYVADDPEISEGKWIDLVGSEAGAEVHRTRPEPRDLAGDMERLIEVQEEPFGSTSIYAQHRVFRLARESGIKVMLDGQGADEMLGGYRPYLAARITSLLRSGNPVQAMRFLNTARGLQGTGLKDLVGWLGYTLLPTGVHSVARKLMGKDLFPEWISKDWFEARGVEFESPVPRSRSRDALRETLYMTLTSSSLPLLLRYEDRNSMAHSIESRVPFLTPELTGFLLSLPEEYLIDRDCTSKAVFRRAMRGIVPDAILDRKDKIGFATPEKEWLTRLKSWVDGILGGESARAIPALDMKAARAEWEGILDGNRRFDWHIWRMINLIRWAERFDVRFGDS